jgi:hypothetical protein
VRWELSASPILVGYWNALVRGLCKKSMQKSDQDGFKYFVKLILKSEMSPLTPTHRVGKILHVIMHWPPFTLWHF